uniref:Chemokine (C-X-C motif) receptor 4a n=1 Tax=Eptatretus burgeri TaxID=7764 RepID=A0A8C4N4E8_EPTBU
MEYSWINISLIDFNNPSLDIHGHEALTICENSASAQQFIHVFLPTVYWIVCILGIIGNGFIFAVLGCSHRRRSTADVYLLNLAAADLLFVFTLPFWAVSAYSQWVFGEVLCRVVHIVFTVNMSSSILLLACISVDRYLAIVRATKTDKLRRSAATRASCCAVWFISLLLAVPDLAFSRAFNLPLSDAVACEHVYPNGWADVWRTVLRTQHHLLAFILPSMVIVCCYGLIIRTLAHSHGQRQRKALKVVVAIVVAFFVCWFPYNLATFLDTLLRLNVVKFSCELEDRLTIAVAITEGLGFMHCCVIPILYAFVGEQFKAHLASCRGFIVKAKVQGQARLQAGYNVRYERPRGPSVNSDSDLSTSMSHA